MNSSCLLFSLLFRYSRKQGVRLSASRSNHAVGALIERPYGGAGRRAVLTDINQTAGRLQEELAEELGCDLVEVSAHAGARPEHAEWQGKIYSRSGKSEKYPDFRSSTGYGTGAGLCGWNCRHTFGPYIEGSSRIWTDEKLAELNAPKYEYQGEKFTEYEARQKEKYFDRQIQRWNREAAAMKAAGLDDSEAGAKVREWKSRSSDFALNRKELGIANPEKRGIIKTERPFAMGLRAPASHILTDEEIDGILRDADELNIKRSILRFNTGGRTGFVDIDQMIDICGDVFPDPSSKSARDRMSQRAVLAHEYYGHYLHHPSEYEIGDWRDEFRASYEAAKNAPNLSSEDRGLLMVDAYDRAREAGEIVEYDDFAKEVIYGIH